MNTDSHRWKWVINLLAAVICFALIGKSQNMAWRWREEARHWQAAALDSTNDLARVASLPGKIQLVGGSNVQALIVCEIGGEWHGFLITSNIATQFEMNHPPKFLLRPE